jgi:hypothetical protein
MRLERAPAIEAVFLGNAALGLIQLGRGSGFAQFGEPLFSGLS